MKRFSFALIFLVFLFSGCKTLTGGGDQPQFEGTHWLLIAMDQKAVTPDEQTFIEFNDLKASGRASCNSFSAEYELKRNKVHFSNPVSTRMYCEGLMDKENQILSNLQRVNRFEIRYGLLYLYSSNELLLTYKK
jgi:heat shock protein HslJ